MPLTRMTGNQKGFALIDLIFVCGMIGVLAMIAMPRMLVAKQSAGATAAVGSMRAISSAQLTFALTCGSGFYAPNLSTLGTAPPGSNEPYIGGGLGSADVVAKSGYSIQMSGTAYSGAPPSCNGLGPGETAQGYKAGASPLEPGYPRHFATNANAQIFEDTASMYPTMPESGEPASGHPVR